MKVFKISLLVICLGYIGVVVAFEIWLGISQPQYAGTLVITTTDDAGERHDRVLRRLSSQGNDYVAVNHWPRAWYYRLLENPMIQVTADDVTNDYTAVLVAGAEHEQVQADNPTPLWFRILTGFPPRYFLRLDPRQG